MLRQKKEPAVCRAATGSLSLLRGWLGHAKHGGQRLVRPVEVVRV